MTSRRVKPSGWCAALCVVALLLVSAPAGGQQPNSPHTGFAYPAGGRQGTTVQVRVGGRYLEGVSDVVFSTRGLRLGMLMIVRGTFLFGLSLWASRALAHDGWLRLCRRLGAERLGVSVRIAFGLLPTLQAELRVARGSPKPAGRRRYRRLRDAAVRLVRQTARIAERLAAEDASNARQTPPTGAASS